jgi:hypothetical protein
MGRRPARFTEADVQRTIKAAQKAGLPIASIRIEADGSILVVSGSPPPVPSFPVRNPWDD